jgi:(1->4)-alpha-D-glucan 1-alpha-D-glucosylmutase
VHPEPVATYRLQLRPGFGFAEAAGLVPYLAELGVSHLYLSPLLQAAAGSLHGYDVADPSRLNAELGGEQAFEGLHQALKSRGLGLMLDIVPNHMSIVGRQNPWWWDLLKLGRASRYASYFDVDWEANEARWPERLLLPVLSDHYGRVLEAGKIRLACAEGETFVEAEGMPFPLDPQSVDPKLQGPERGAQILRNALNRDPDGLDALLGRQHYRLALWRAADRDLGYRRFFDVKELAGLRSELPEVFEAGHALIVKLVAEGKAQALRVDHPDGLREPAEYFRRLRQACPGAWIVAEKILEAGEAMPGDWPVEGSTGYDFLALCDGLFIDPAANPPLDQFFRRFSSQPAAYGTVKLESRRDALHGLLASELNRLSQIFTAVCERHRRHRDYSSHELRLALLECAAQFPVYRAYARAPKPGLPHLSPGDRRHIGEAAAKAAAANPALDPELFRFLGDILTLRWPEGPELDLALRFQQLCAAAMAKGVEDTAFYRYQALASLCEVGAGPERFGVGPQEFHKACLRARLERPYGLLAGSTHDTKRSEDARARLNLISERPEAWIKALQSWSALNARHKSGALPGGAMELCFYQNLLAAWPVSEERLNAAMLKSAREAKRETSWKKPDPAYEAALARFVSGALRDEAFLRSFEDFARPLAAQAKINSLAAALLRLCSPGVPDIYQGCEAWRFSLVDPDNRRPVDFPALQAALRGLKGPPSPEGDSLGLCKLWLIRAGLALRRRRPACFGAAGIYEPLAAEGVHSSRALAFLRGGACLALVPRLGWGMKKGWQGTRLRLPEGRWKNLLDLRRGLSGPQPLDELLHHFPVALLEREDA